MQPISSALHALEPRNTETVAKHLVMAGRYLDIDPEFALAHAVRASRCSAGRIAAVREAVGIALTWQRTTSWPAWAAALHRRISGSVDHLAAAGGLRTCTGTTTWAQEMIAEFGVVSRLQCVWNWLSSSPVSE